MQRLLINKLLQNKSTYIDIYIYIYIYIYMSIAYVYIIDIIILLWEIFHKCNELYIH